MLATSPTAEGATAAELQHDRRRGRLVAAHEDRLLREDEVDARGLHGSDGADCAGELALERAAIEDALLELGRAEAHLVEALEAHRPAARQATARELEAQLARLVLRDLDHRPIALEAVRDLHLLQLRDHRRRVVAVEVRVEDGVGLVRRAEREEASEGHERERRRDGEDPRGRESPLIPGHCLLRPEAERLRERLDHRTLVRH